MKSPDPSPDVPPLPDHPTSDISGDLMALVRWQVGFGPRYPGCAAHTAFRDALGRAMSLSADKLLRQDFQVSLQGRPADCSNILGVFRGDGSSPRGPLLIGTHFDSRLIADNEEDPALRGRPIPGANDGGSGTAILLLLASVLKAEYPARLTREIQLVFFDAEDVGHLDGNPFAAGAEYYAKHFPAGRPDEVIVLDMVGGKDMVFDVDAHIAHYERSLMLTREVFSLGTSIAPRAFSMEKPEPFKYIVSDHYPFMLQEIPSCILIDIDYPQWHTGRDLPEALTGRSLFSVYKLLLEYIRKTSL